ncbi:MAG: hypothetical protein ACYDAG_10235 [Chloroflexota bacterium]
MSEYQYYEFLAIDRPLSADEMGELRALSTRAEMTPWSLVNTYNWGNFRGNPSTLMERYFDAFLYLANWGTRRLMLRVPSRLLDQKTAEAYCFGESASVQATGEHLIIEFNSEDEHGDWEDGGEGWLSSIIPLRADLAAGDVRSLYLGWLLCAQLGELDDSDVEPPPPPDLRNLSGSLKSFADFLRIDLDLIAAAAEGAPGTDADDRESESAGKLGAWSGSLPEVEKNRLLTRLAEGNDPHLRAELLNRFKRANAGSQMGKTAVDKRRTVAQLLTAERRRTEEERRRVAERDEQERIRRERDAAAARDQHLHELAAREADAWRKVDAWIGTKRPADYDEAVRLLADLREVSVRTNRTNAFAERIRELRQQHGKKPSLLQRLDKAGLTAGRPVGRSCPIS